MVQSNLSPMAANVRNLDPVETLEAVLGEIVNRGIQDKKIEYFGKKLSWKAGHGRQIVAAGCEFAHDVTEVIHLRIQSCSGHRNLVRVTRSRHAIQVCDPCIQCGHPSDRIWTVEVCSQQGQTGLYCIDGVTPSPGILCTVILCPTPCELRGLVSTSIVEERHLEVIARLISSDRTEILRIGRLRRTLASTAVQRRLAILMRFFAWCYMMKVTSASQGSAKGGWTIQERCGR